jgi:molybdopterin-containing oxidoreductase family membrane subunit
VSAFFARYNEFERFEIISYFHYTEIIFTVFLDNVLSTFVDIGIFIGTIGFFFVYSYFYAKDIPVVHKQRLKQSSGRNYKDKEN